MSHASYPFHSDSKHPGFIDRIVIGKRLSLTLVRRYLYKNGDSSEGVVGRRKRISLRRPCPQWAEEELVLGRCCHLRENAVIVSFALDWIARRVFYGGVPFCLQQSGASPFELVDALAPFPAALGKFGAG